MGFKSVQNAALLFAFLISFLIPLASFSQSEIPDVDFVLMKNGRRFDGSVIRKLGQLDFDRIEFLRRGETTSYGPEDISGFGLGSGEYFETMKLPDGDQEVFAQILIVGSIRLVRKNGIYYAGGADRLEKLEDKISLPKSEGVKVSSRHLPYVTTLNTLMAGDCQGKIYPLIQRTKLREDDLVWLFTKYYDCEKSEYTYYGQLRPDYLISPVIRATVFQSGIKTAQLTGDRIDNFQTSMAFQGYAGFRLHSFRNSPRMGIEAGIGYDLVPLSIESELKANLGRFTGTQEMSVSLISIPITYQYILSKVKNREIYLHVGSGYAFSKTSVSYAIQDIAYTNFPYTILEEGEFGRVKRGITFFHGAIGLQKSLKEKGIFGVSIQGRYLPKFYSIEINNNNSVYHRIDAGLGITYVF